MHDTNFKNCHGIDEDDHLTSSYDIGIMTRELLLKHPEITTYTSIWMDSLRDGKSELVNTNKLIRTYEGATGLKTGSTSLALYNLSATATRNNLSLIAIVLRAPTPKIRFSEAKLLLDYGFNTYYLKEICKENQLYKTIKINKGVEEELNIIYESNVNILSKIGSSSEITENISLPESIEAPVYKGDIVGKISYLKDNIEISSVNLIAEKDIPKLSFISIFKELTLSCFSLLR